ncbi:MAG: M23 family metallopeptidase [Patescibacteria group bacterium]|nr:M23 family metallopeptidase [Patescibacteria group bacterium]
MNRNTTKLQLPFNDYWLVLWGGDTQELNQHHDVSDQKYAFDFVIVDENNLTHEDSSKNESHYAFGKEVLAPAAGTVIKVIDGIPDNKPGETNENAIAGNVVMINHENSEVSVLAHLKNGSIRVKPDEEVVLGQIIGACGNSGNSTEPHIHYHLQKGINLYSGEGIKCFFQNVNVKNKDIKKEYSPIMDDIVSNYE